MQRLFQIIGAVSIVALSFAAVTESFAQSIGSLPAKQLCWHALNPDTLSTRDQSPNYSGYVAEAERRGLTVDACRQVIGAADGGASNPPARTDGTSNPPASTESGSGRRSSAMVEIFTIVACYTDPDSPKANHCRLVFRSAVFRSAEECERMLKESTHFQPNPQRAGGGPVVSGGTVVTYSCMHKTVSTWQPVE
jgi:hypothetical protein